MDLTIDQVLQKAVEAHKAGRIQEADRLYTAILKSRPRHPDANHNLGVLAVSIGKAQDALPFFRTALEANPSIAQFWISYIDTLIKLDHSADAKTVFDQAKSKGVKGEAFDSLEKRLAKYPKNKRAIKGLKSLPTKKLVKSSYVQDPPQDQAQLVINLYAQGQLVQAFDKASQLLRQFPNSVFLYISIGNALQGLQPVECDNRVGIANILEGVWFDCLERRVLAGKGELPAKGGKGVVLNALQGWQAVECDDRAGIASILEGLSINRLKRRVLAAKGERPTKW